MSRRRNIGYSLSYDYDISTGIKIIYAGKMKKIYKRHFEWVALTAGLFTMALMDPYVNNGLSFCLFETIGLTFCPGEGLGHSIAFLARGEVGSALDANMMGPAAFLILSSRILHQLNNIFLKGNNKPIENNG